tara:strand:+ start:699 stop:893 length:195 start_codon:yes stop_codon:yes gene_type:complete
MSDKIEEAWLDYQADSLTDPMHRYEHNHKDIFQAGWDAAQKNRVKKVRESVWVHAPVAPDDDPE